MGEDISALPRVWVLAHLKQDQTMKRPRIGIFIVMATVLLLVRSASAQQDALTITPIEGVEVSVTMDGGTPDHTTTDKDGSYKLSYLAAGKYTLEFKLPKAAATSKSTAKGKPAASYDSVALVTSQEKSPYGIDEIRADFTLKKVTGIAPASQASATTLQFEVKANQGNVTGHVTRVAEPVAPKVVKAKKKKAK